MYFLGCQIFSNTLGGDDEVASIRRARDAAARIPGSARHSSQQADDGARRVRDDAAEGRPRVGVLRGARVGWAWVEREGSG